MSEKAARLANTPLKEQKGNCVSPDGCHTIEYDLGEVCTDCGRKKSETEKILADKDLMAKIRKGRQGSTSSPYKPLSGQKKQKEIEK